MPLTSSERSKIYRDKKKDDPAFKGKEQKRQAEIRKELKIGGSKKKRDKVKKQSAKRSKRYRRSKKMYKASLDANMTPDTAPELPQHSQYSSKATKMKAVYRYVCVL
jgi:flagellar biosynthesis GTPase FlhF